MEKNIKSSANNLSGLEISKIGNYTKGAIKSFEENIVNQTNYLEKVENGLNNKEREDK